MFAAFDAGGERFDRFGILEEPTQCTGCAGGGGGLGATCVVGGGEDVLIGQEG